jgi:prepilin-type N-terminal cleavage/methylation domain-containing protein
MAASSMATRASKPWLPRWFLKHQQSQVAGFTLLEVLISLLISGLIVSGLLYLVVELLRIDRREFSLEQTQRDMQRALDYIRTDLEEAVFVYDDPRQVIDTSDAFGRGINDNGITSLPEGTPVLAFWRPDAAADSQLPGVCSTSFTASSAAFQECQVLRLRRASYTLVVYLQRNNDGQGSWQGRSRIIRFEFPKYRTMSTLTRTTGYQDPTSISPGTAFTGGDVFAGWTASSSGTGTPGAAGSGKSSVLVDFVNSPAATGARNCNELGADSSAYVFSPSTASTGATFYACIRDTTPVVGALADPTQIYRSGQDVYVYLQGNANPSTSNQALSLSPGSDTSQLPTLRSQVLVRGVIDKDQAN